MTAKEKSIQLIDQMIRSHMVEMNKLKKLLSNEMPKLLRNSFIESIESYQADLRFMMELKQKLSKS